MASTISMRDHGMKPVDIVVAGHLCLDLYPDLGKFEGGSFVNRLLPGKLLSVGNMSFCTGGPVSNTALALNRLGVKVRCMGKVGADAFGSIIADVLRKHHPHMGDNLILSAETGSSYTIILSAPGIDRIFLHYPGTNDSYIPDDIDYDLVSQCRLFHFGYPPLMKMMFIEQGAHLTEIYRRVKDCNVITSLDMAWPDPNSDAGKADWEAILKNTLPFVDIFAPSIEEILYMIDRQTFTNLSKRALNGNLLPLIELEILNKLVDRLSAWGAKIIALKLGDRGFFIHSGSKDMLKEITQLLPIDANNWSMKQIWAPCFQANFVGAAGSGDATVAGFISAMIRGLPIEEAATMAVAVGACCVEALDTVSGIQEWDATQQRIAQGWSRHPLQVKDPSWRFDGESQNWIRELAH